MKRVVISFISILAIVGIILNMPIPRRYVGSYKIAGDPNAERRIIK